MAWSRACSQTGKEDVGVGSRGNGHGCDHAGQAHCIRGSSESVRPILVIAVTSPEKSRITRRSDTGYSYIDSARSL